jgi:hypothetical protein
MFSGGSLISDKTFKKILSIGYEFETHDIAKLSLHNNKKTLINSNLTLRILQDKKDKKSVKTIDDNYLLVRIPIGQEKSTNINEEKNVDEDMDDEEREFMEAFKEEIELEKLEKHENDSYLEYFNENRKKDNKENIKFQITNDVGDGDFGYMLNDYCKKLSIPKNDMFSFKTKNGKMLDIKFAEELTNDCKTFSGVEYVVTYYNPKKDNPNVIIDTFVDACSRIIDHLGDLKKTNGELMIVDNEKTKYKTIGNIENERCIYHKPKTNLFYIDTYDNKNTIKLKTIGDVDFVPQMTFRCKAIDLLDIVKEILKTSDKNIKNGSSVILSNTIDLEEIEVIDSIVDNLFISYNKTSEKKISLDTIEWRNLKAYLFLIYYKLFYYIQNSSEITHKKDIEDTENKNKEDDDDDDENYLKDFIGFSSRHSNYDLYNKSKELLEKYYGIKDIETIHKILCQPEVISTIYEKNISDSYENGEFNYVDPHKTELEETSKNYGNPMYSFSSYFKHFEKPPAKHDNDWLIESKIDAYSTTFALTGDDIMVENRSFRYSLGLFLRNMVDKKLSKDTISVREMHKIVNALYGQKLKKMINLEVNPLKNKLTRKCKHGYYRNLDFVCARTKSATKKKGKKLSATTIKELKLKNNTKKMVKTTSVSV